MAFVTAIVVIGGVRRIGQFSEALVPLMSAVFILSGLAVFFFHFERIPEVFALILRHALAPAPALGGFAGAAVSQAIQVGMSRGMLSNEAGLGTAPIAHATANTEHPFQQGMWGAFEVAIDTLVICTISAFAVLSTGVLSSGESGIDLVITAFTTVFPPEVAGGILSFAILTFCLTTQIAFFIYFETAVTNLFGARSVRYLRWVYLIPGVLFAGVANVDRLWVFANLAVGSCALPNLIAVLALSGPFFVLMRDYVRGDNRYATAIVDASRDYVK
jgi:AGCS family alanine or glycine:cation symporter